MSSANSKTHLYALNANNDYSQATRSRKMTSTWQKTVELRKTFISPVREKLEFAICDLSKAPFAANEKQRIKELSEYSRTALDKARHHFGKAEDRVRFGHHYWSIDPKAVPSAIKFIEDVPAPASELFEHSPLRVEYKVAFHWKGFESWELRKPSDWIKYPDAIFRNETKSKSMYCYLAVTMTRHTCFVKPFFVFPVFDSIDQLVRFTTNVQKSSPFELRIRNFREVGVKKSFLQKQIRKLSVDTDRALQEGGLR